MASKFNKGDKVKARWQSFDLVGKVKHVYNSQEAAAEDWHYIVDFNKAFYLAKSQRDGIQANSISFSHLVWPECCLTLAFEMKLGSYDVEILSRDSVKVGCTTFNRQDINQLLALMVGPKNSGPKYSKGQEVTVNYGVVCAQAEVMSEAIALKKDSYTYVVEIKNKAVSISVGGGNLSSSWVVIHEAFLSVKTPTIQKLAVTKASQDSATVGEIEVTRKQIEEILAEMDKKA